MKNKIVFLILHYITLEDTQKCVSSILERYPNNENIEIVIVDNNSNNNSSKELVKLYKDNNRIHTILLDKNLGFARGNNEGFKYAKEKLKADFIIMINNDTYLIQNDFCEIIEEEYKKSKFAVLGPRILMNDNKICDYDDKPETTKELRKKIRRLKLRKILNEIHLHFLYDALVFIKKLVSVMFNKKQLNIDTSIRKEDVVLQGCALIFSKKYIELFEGIDDRTFLFEEEQLLYWRVKDNNLLSVYNPLLMIYHNENSSTNASTNKNMYKKRKLVIENELISKNILLSDLIKKEEK